MNLIKLLKVAGASGLTVVLASALGFAQAATQTQTTSTTTTTTTADLPGQIQKELQANPALNSVAVTVSGNIVTLSGTVPMQSDKDQAMLIAQRLAPNMAVQNNISIQPQAATAPGTPQPGTTTTTVSTTTTGAAQPAAATGLQLQIQNQLRTDPAYQNVMVASTGPNEVTLTGMVETNHERKDAAKLAKKVAPTAHIHNKIVVQKRAISSTSSQSIGTQSAY